MKNAVSILVIALLLGSVLVGNQLLQQNQNPQTKANEEISATDSFAGKITCRNAGFYKNDPRNGAGKYYMIEEISASRPGNMVVLYASWKNTGGVNLTKVYSVLAPKAKVNSFSVVDSDGHCAEDSSNVFSCKYDQWDPQVPGNASGGAVRIKLSNTLPKGTIIRLSSHVGAQEAFRNGCEDKTITIK